MRNLKKVLALVLVFAMTFTMVSIAALEDVAGSDYENQIKTNVALGIIKGKDNGNFDPTGNVTRAEMAKMIYVMLKGKDDGAVIYKGASDLKDVAGTWAEGYINYCYSLDIIAGRGNGIFDPNANVTAAEASKMLLAALGWDADKEGLVGASWAIKAIALAEKEDILDEFPEDGDIMAPLNREGAANLVYNALFADTVTYIAWGEDAGMIVRGDTLAEDVFELIEADAYLTATQEVGLGTASPEGTTTFAPADGDDDLVVANTSLDYNNLGRLYTIYYKEDASRADEDLGANATLFTAVYSDDNKVVATTGGNFSKGAGGFASGTYYVQAADNSYHLLDANWNDKTYINGEVIADAESYSSTPAYKTGLPVYLLTDADNASPEKVKGTGAYTSNVGYQYAADEYNYVVAFVPTFMKVTSTTTDSVTFENNATEAAVTVKDEDLFYKGITSVKKGDYALVYVMNDGNKYVVTEPLFVSGKIIGFNEGGKPILDNGAAITSQGTDGIPGTMDKKAFYAQSATMNGETVTIYTDGKYGVYIEGAEVTDQYLVAMAGTIGADEANRAGTEWDLFVTALFADGTDKEIEVSKVDGEKVEDATSAAEAEGMLSDDEAYSYELVDGLYELTTVEPDDTFDGTTVANYYENTGAFKNSGNYYYIADDTTVFVAEDGEDVVAVKAADIEDDFITSAAITVDYIAGDLDGKVADLEYVYITTDASLTTADSDYKFARALGDGQVYYNATEKKYYASYKLFVEGEVATYVSNAVFSTGTLKSTPADRALMYLAFDGDKIANKSDKSDVDGYLFKKTTSGSEDDYTSNLNTAFGLSDGDDGFDKLYVITTSAKQLRGDLLFTVYTNSDGSTTDAQFFIDEDTDIYGFNSVSATAAANEIVTRGDGVRNTTVIYDSETNVALYILVDAGSSFGKETR